MKYIIMCGGKYQHFTEKPRQLIKVNGEILIERTIRLLRKNGIKDIAISTNYEDFNYLGVPILKHNNSYEYKNNKLYGYWVDAFYLINEPVCYIFGDVYFSENAIKTIVETKTDDIEFFGSKEPFDKQYPKNHVEPFALKVVNTEHLKEAIQKTKDGQDKGIFWRLPLVWELWTVIKNAPLQKNMDDYPCDYIAINDYTSDIDRPWDVINLEMKMEVTKMVRVEVIEYFTLEKGIVKFEDLKELVRKNPQNAKDGELFVGDIFLCTKEQANYLLGENQLKKAFVKIIEVIPEKEEQETKEPIKRKRKKKEV